MKPFRVVVDTNVVIAALRSKHGASNTLLAQLNEPRLQLHVSNALLLEYEEKLHQQKRELGLSNTEIEDLLDGFCALATKHFVPLLLRPASPDSDDDFLVDLAVTAEADYLVTYNLRDLHLLVKYGINVVTPGEMLRILRGAQ